MEANRWLARIIMGTMASGVFKLLRPCSRGLVIECLEEAAEYALKDWSYLHHFLETVEAAGCEALWKASKAREVVEGLKAYIDGIDCSQLRRDLFVTCFDVKGDIAWRAPFNCVEVSSFREIVGPLSPEGIICAVAKALGRPCYPEAPISHYEDQYQGVTVIEGVEGHHSSNHVLIPAEIWIPIFERVYEEISREYMAIVGGSQIFYVVAGIALESKDIDLFIGDYNPMRIAEAISSMLGIEERFEVFKRGDNMITHVYIPARDKVLQLEIMSRTHLGKISGTPLMNEVIFVERGGKRYWSLSLEAYAVLQATRPEGIRRVDIDRFAAVEDRIDWERAFKLAEMLGVENKVSVFKRLIKDDIR
jgi:hypothetical protein